MSFELKNLHYGYQKEQPILNDVSFSLEEGDIAIILGPNGAGKSTLIKCLVGLLKPEQGTISIDGTDLVSLKGKERAKLISYVPQNIAFPSLSVYDAILLGRLPYFTMSPSKKDHEETEKVIQKLSLENIASRNVDELSGGERQKVAIARALVQSSKFMVFDEPTSNLDVRNQLMILDLIEAIAKESHSMVLIAMHDINQALRIGTKFLLLQGNSLSAPFPPSELSEEKLGNLYGESCKIKEIDGERIIVFPKNRKE